MLANHTDVIAALITPPGRGGVGIVRVSGSDLSIFFDAVLAYTPTPRFAHYLSFLGGDNEEIDKGIAIFYPSPRSFTGEDVIEFQGHGGPVVMDLLLQRVIALGARQALPGEFSERAYLNGKMDLTQVEAVADLIDASTVEAARGAINTLQGKFSKEIEQLLEDFTLLRVYVEAAIDFPEEEVDFLTDGKVATDLLALVDKLKKLLSSASQGALLKEGISVVIVGKPNAGKSSLLNTLSGLDKAIVTDIPGTTRDVLHEHISIDGMPLHIIDTAGLRETQDAVESKGVEKAWQEISQADHILFVVDGSEPYELVLPEDWSKAGREQEDGKEVTFLLNKTDKPNYKGSPQQQNGHAVIEISTKTEHGLDQLKEHLKRCAGYTNAGGGIFSARTRHITALKQTLDHLMAAREQLLVLGAAGELIAEDLKQAQQALGTITGDYSSDDLLGDIFSSFCIGK